MATFHRLFEIALQHGRAKIHPKGSTKKLELELNPRAKSNPDSEGFYCLVAMLTEDNPMHLRYLGGPFWYHPEKKVIQLDRKMDKIQGILESSLKEILSPYYDELPPIVR